VVRNAVFGAAAVSSGKSKLKNLCQGQTMIWFSSATDSDNPNILKDVGKLAQKYKENTLLIGGSVDDLIITAQTFVELEGLPSKVVLFGQLLGLIQYPATSIASLLSQTPQVLAASLEQHKKQLE
jgi:large subunit ribosomal protein L10